MANQSHATSSAVHTIPLETATAERVAPYGVMLGETVHRPGLSIPFYRGSVEEGANLDFHYHEHCVVRTARISPRPMEVFWLERHLRLSQLFVGLGSEPFALVLGKPDPNSNKPALEQLAAFAFPPGHGIILHCGTWHDFPLALERPVVVLTMNSAEVVAALAAVASPQDMDTGDVYKLELARHLGVTIQVTA